jgi:hypothetical protein
MARLVGLGLAGTSNPSASELARGYSEQITRAGLPTAITLAGRSRTTTARHRPRCSRRR